MNTASLFLRRWRHAPGQMASITPSSAILARSMARLVPQGPGWVVEVGAGTGAITEGLIRAGHGQRLRVVEYDPELAAAFSRQYPEVPIFVGDAALMPLEPQDGKDVDVIVSSLGFRNMDTAQQQRIVQRFQLLMARSRTPGFLQYSYGLRPPIDAGVARATGCHPHLLDQVFRNLPPARVWLYRWNRPN